MATYICPERLVPKVVDKGWGKEIWMVNNNKYCGKLLQFNENAKFSMHYHIKKDESWYINTGEFIFRWIDGRNANVIEEILKPGDCIRIPTNLPHQLEVKNGGEIIEISTEHFDDDSIRVFKGDSQKL